MKILFVADSRSPLAHNWIRYFIDSPHEIHLVSTYPNDPPFKLSSFHVIPAAFSSLVGKAQTSAGNSPGDQSGGIPRYWLRNIVPVGIRTWFRQWFGTYTLPPAARRLRKIIDEVRPDLVHAMRIPFEGMLAALALQYKPEIPLMVSVWGNDFTLHATKNKSMSWHTRAVMERTKALHTDTFRDQLLAQEWGFDPQNPVIVQPCAGGVNMDVFYPPDRDASGAEIRVINPRGMRAYVRNDTFFRSIPLVIKEKQDLRFICPAMKGESEAENWLKKLGIEEAVELLPRQANKDMAKLFRQSQIVVSITTHDGTPNSLLEAMACGCFPIVGDIKSLGEWISHNENGILVDPSSPTELAAAILTAIQEEGLRSRAREINLKLVRERAEYQHRMAETLEFYEKIIT